MPRHLESPERERMRPRASGLNLIFKDHGLWQQVLFSMACFHSVEHEYNLGIQSSYVPRPTLPCYRSVE